jgi:hypothetical protein
MDGVKVGRSVPAGGAVAVAAVCIGVEVGGRIRIGVLVVKVGTTAISARVGSGKEAELKPSASTTGLSGITTRKTTTTKIRNVATTNITARILNRLTAQPPLRFELRLAAILFPSIVHSYQQR